MKRFFIAIFFLIALSASCLFLVNHLDKNTLAIKDEINQIKDAVAANNQSRADEAMQQLVLHWEEEKYLFHALAGSNYCDPFESALDRSEVWLGQKEENELFAELAELYARIDQLWDTQAIHPKNLF
ncbi:DUF4363 family protein [Oscillospiraceae bacterium LTW-04]|nr:DUF4363 family protein [Oscillospiraceae bacterium MB24-C1]